MKFTLRRRGEVMDESLSLHFMLPIIGENVFNIAIGLVYSRFISTISGSALAAIGLANNVQAVLFGFFGIFITGTAVLVARHVGAGNGKEAAETVEQSVFLTLVVTIAVAIGFILSAGGLIRLLMPASDDAMRGEAAAYFRMLMISLPGYILYSMLSAVFRSLGDGRTPLLGSVVMNLSLLGSAWLFIRVLRWEAIGAGLAYVESRLA